MDKTAEIKAQQKEELRKTGIILLIAIALVIAGVCGFLRFYSTYIDKTLYAERLNQMREVTTQLFSGLEDVVQNQWRTVDEQCRVLQTDKPQTWDEFYSFMEKQAYLSDLESIQCSILAVDENGAYYTQKGRQGLVQEREYLLADPERLSYVSNSLISDQTNMVFLMKLDDPVTIQDENGSFTLHYYGISQNMEQLDPYFECSAYSGNSSVYVVDGSGLKLFSSVNAGGNSSSGGLLKGYNVFTTLRNMSYLHGSSFEDTQKELEDKNIAYSNALLGDTELYYAMYSMENAAWTLIFLVPSEYVAINTVQLVNMTIRMVLIFAVALIIISVLIVVLMLKRQQRAALEAERKNSAKLERLNTELEAASKAKTDFLANMSHDIRTPMNAIVGITRLMEHDRRDAEKMDTYIRKIQMSSNHLLSLINDVLDMSKIESSAVTLNHERIRLADQIGQIESMIRPQAEEHRQEFTIRVHEINHEYLIGDAVRLRQVLINLLSNAVKYTPDGGRIMLEISELPCGIKDRAKYVIAVTDNGYGMTAEFVSHIFEPFTRAENSTTNRVQGTGLGMAITKNIVDLMGGSISVQSELGKGSRFEVELTVRIDRESENEVELPYSSVMIISDEEAFIRNAKAAFINTGVILNFAGSEEEVDELLRSEPADIILLGGSLQGRRLADNVHRLRAEVAKAARENKNEKQTLMFYCCDRAGEEQLNGISDNGGVDGVLARPLFISNLINAIDRARSSEPSDPTEGSSVLDGMHFLCAEDNALNAEILEAVLDMNGASCVICSNGKEITEMFENVKPGEYDAILMDVQMPVMNGLDATRAIRSSSNPLGKTIPVIAMTANAFSEDVQNCLEAGMDAHVAKPLDVDVLESTLKSLFKARSSGGGM